MQIEQHGPVDHVGHVTDEAAEGLTPGLALGLSPGHVGPREGMRACTMATQVQGPVELAIAASIQAMALDLAGSSGDGRGAGYKVGGGVRAEAPPVTPPRRATWRPTAFLLPCNRGSDDPLATTGPGAAPPRGGDLAVRDPRQPTNGRRARARWDCSRRWRPEPAVEVKTA